jgi:hypothetical protein
VASPNESDEVWTFAGFLWSKYPSSVATDDLDVMVRSIREFTDERETVSYLFKTLPSSRTERMDV